MADIERERDGILLRRFSPGEIVERDVVLESAVQGIS
jgi:hypothetical protein